MSTTRVNVGGPAYTDADDHLWSADSGIDGTTYTSALDPLGTANPTLYRTGRTAASVLGGTFTVTRGIYYATFYFVDQASTVAGQRVFNVFVNGVEYVHALDLFATTRAVNYVHNVTVGPFACLDGTITITIASVTGSVILNALELRPDVMAGFLRLENDEGNRIWDFCPPSAPMYGIAQQFGTAADPIVRVPGCDLYPYNLQAYYNSSAAGSGFVGHGFRTDLRLIAGTGGSVLGGHVVVSIPADSTWNPGAFSPLDTQQPGAQGFQYDVSSARGGDIFGISFGATALPHTGATGARNVIGTEADSNVFGDFGAHCGLQVVEKHIQVAVGAASNATPIVIGTALGVAHGLSDGQRVWLYGVGGNLAANGSHFAKVTGYSASTCALYTDRALTIPVAGSGPYTSGGFIGQRGERIDPATGVTPATYDDAAIQLVNDAGAYGFHYGISFRAYADSTRFPVTADGTLFYFEGGTCFRGIDFNNMVFSGGTPGTNPACAIYAHGQSILGGSFAVTQHNSGFYSNTYYDGAWQHYTNGFGGFISFGSDGSFNIWTTTAAGLAAGAAALTPRIVIDKNGVTDCYGAIYRLNHTQGQITAIKNLQELTTILAAATTDTAIQIPANAIVLAVSVRVVTIIPTAANFTVTGASSATAFQTGASVAVAAGTTDVGTKSCPYLNTAAQAIRITPNVPPAAATGEVRVSIHYIEITAPAV